MRKHLPAIILSLLFTMLLSGVAVASEAGWQIKWQEDGSLQEKVTLPSALSVQTLNSDWQKTSSGEQQIYSRTVKDWNTYVSSEDSLPLAVQQRNFIVCTATEIKPTSQANEGSLYASLKGIPAMKLEIEVPGIVADKAAGKEGSNNNTVVWEINRPGEVLPVGFGMNAITFDGWMLGISILTLGVIVMFFFFITRMRRVDRIIAETYSLDNIVIEDEDDDETV